MSSGHQRLISAVLILALLAAGCGAASSSSVPQSQPPAQSGPQQPTVVQAGEHWFKMPDPLDEASVDGFGKKMREIQEKYLTQQNQVFYAVIPDKTEFAPEGVPRLDSAPMLKQLKGQMGRAQWIDLTGTLALDDYFLADGHWKQDRLQPVLDALGAAMGFEVKLDEFQTSQLEGFHGSYEKDLPQGQSLPLEPLTLLTPLATDDLVVKHFQDPCTALYDTSKDPVSYDVFLSGVDPILTITNPDARTDRSLVIFRDSFGSSLAPLLCAEYRTITLVDLRYMASGLLPQYVEFTNQDVLFLYSAAVVNRSVLLR